MGRRTVGSTTLVALVALSALSAGSAAAAVRVQVRPDRTDLQLGETVVVTVSVESDELGSPAVEPPASEELRIVEAGTTSRFELVFGGQARRTLEHTYRLEPTRAGRVRVGAFVCRSGRGVRAQSQPFFLTVREPPPAPRSADDIQPNDVLTTLVEVTPQPLYVGQQALLTVTRYARRNMAECACEAPEVQGAWSDSLLDQPERPDLQNLKGARFERQRLRRAALFPLEAGELLVPALTVRCRTRGQGFFGAGSETLSRTTAPVHVEVKPLPDAGRPRGFAGAVGQFRLAARLDRRGLRQGEPVTLQLQATGRGNFRGFSLAPPRLPQGVRAYPPTQRDEARYDSLGQLSGSKTLEIIIVPETSGLVALPAFDLPYFDPVAAQYRVAKTRPMRLRVAPAGSNSGGVTGGTPTATPEAPAQAPDLPELRPLRPAASHLGPRPEAGPPWTRTPLFWILVALLPALYLGLLSRDAWLRVRERARPEQRARGAARRADQRMQGALRAGSPAEVWSEVVGALHGYLEDRSGLPTLGLTRPQLSETLRDRLGYPPEPVQDLVTLLDDADLARFAGGAGASPAADAVRRGRAVVAALDQHRPPAQPGVEGST